MNITKITIHNGTYNEGNCRRSLTFVLNPIWNAIGARERLERNVRASINPARAGKNKKRNGKQRERNGGAKG